MTSPPTAGDTTGWVLTYRPIRRSTTDRVMPLKMPRRGSAALAMGAPKAPDRSARKVMVPSPERSTSPLWLIARRGRGAEQLLGRSPDHRRRVLQPLDAVIRSYPIIGLDPSNPCVPDLRPASWSAVQTYLNIQV